MSFDGPLSQVALAVAAAFVGSLFAAAEAATSALPEGRLQALADGTAVPSGHAHASSASAPHKPGRDHAVFARFLDDRLGILSRWLVARVLGVGLASALFVQAAERSFSPRVALFLAMLAGVASYGLFAETLSVLARRRPERSAALGLRFLRLAEWIVSPLAAPLALLGRIVSERLPRENLGETRFTESDVEWAVTEGEKAGTLDEEPAEMIRNVLDFKELTAKEVMVPRRHIAGFDIALPLDKVIAHVATDGHSRYPVYRESLDNVIGLLYVKDLFEVVKDARIGEVSLSDLIRKPVLFVIEAQSAASVLREMRARRLHMALVSDEFGGTSGLVTLEDVIEEIVGEIHDEYDTEGDGLVQEIGGGRLIVDAAIAIADLEKRLHHELPRDGDFESLGGLVIHRAGRVPDIGTKVHLDGYDVIVREADATHVIRVEMLPKRGRESQPDLEEIADAEG